MERKTSPVHATRLALWASTDPMRRTFMHFTRTRSINHNKQIAKPQKAVAHNINLSKIERISLDSGLRADRILCAKHTKR
jgi:hypothetical protein